MQRRLDRVLNAVVGVPVCPRHPRQIAAIGAPLRLLFRLGVARDADDVGSGDGLVVAVVEGFHELAFGDGERRAIACGNFVPVGESANLNRA